MKLLPLLLFLIVSVFGLNAPSPKIKERTQPSDTPERSWTAASGLAFPMEMSGPCRLVSAEIEFHARLTTASRRTELPTYRQWQVSQILQIKNPNSHPVQVTVGLPEIASATDGVKTAQVDPIFSLDKVRVPITQTNKRGPNIVDLPPIRVFNAVTFPIAANAQRRVDLLYLTPVPKTGVTLQRFQFITSTGRSFDPQSTVSFSLKIHFDHRVRLIEDSARPTDIFFHPPQTTEMQYFDDGRYSRLEIATSSWPAGTHIGFDFEPIGYRSSDPMLPGIMGTMRPVEQMSLAELEMARLVLRSLRGWGIRDRQSLEILNNRPWEACNPAFRVAHGLQLGTSSIDRFLQTHHCSQDCVAVRKRARDPFRPPFAQPLCWYAPVYHFQKTRIVDPEDLATLKKIDQRLSTLKATPSDGAKATSSGAHGRTEPLTGERSPQSTGCNCRTRGGRFKNFSLASQLISN